MSFRRRRPSEPQPPIRPDSPRIVVIGPCASGKTTLVAGLRQLGFAAAACGQEHSEISTLWRHTSPDVVVALEVDLETIRERRGVTEWPEWLYKAQRRRLQRAEEAAAVHIDTTTVDAAGALAIVAEFLANAPGAQGDAVDPPGSQAPSAVDDRRSN